MNAIVALSTVVLILGVSVIMLIVQFRSMSRGLLDERRYSLLESVADGVFILDNAWRFTHVNEKAEELLSATALELIGRRIEKILDPLASDLLPEIRSVRKSGEPVERTQYFASKRMWVEIRIQPAKDEVLVYLRDVSDRKRAENMLRDSERRLRLLLEQVPALLWTVDLDLVFTSVVGAGLTYHGLNADKLAGDRIEVLLPDNDSKAIALEAIERVFRGESERFEVFYNERWLQHHVEPLRTASGAIIGAIGVALDITEIKETADHLARLARVDALTQLPNRLALQESLAEAVAQAERADTGLGVLFVDLDRFKIINDTLGHHAGDELLQQFSLRLQRAVGDRARVFRSGGDEFVVIAQMDGVTSLPMIAADIQLALAEPFIIEDRQLFVGASIGCSSYPDDGASVEELLSRADTAMYRAKYSGRSRVGFVDVMKEDAGPYRLRLEQDLHYAIPRGELRLEFQPIIDTLTGRVSGAEALVRWNHNQHGRILPEEFIGIAEESGMILPISRWVLRTACAFAADLRRSGHPDFRVAVNLSARDFGEVDLADTIVSILEDAELSPGALEIEITESMMIDDLALMTMRTLRDKGVRIVVDDFGIAYSSLGYLKRLPITGVKIDRTFIRDISDVYDQAIVRAIVTLARSLSLEIVAEGIESDEQWNFI
ncbi:MAG: EAL domain-containing protein, partial [Candidatus Eremiobacteraeota bacterium]|nr:EAL domain-containing protein [Candidatus Eremiobacteraeota bacterium]